MRNLTLCVALVAAAVLAQAVLPDRATWHEGWYSVALALLVLCIAFLTRVQVRGANARRATGLVLAACGAGVLAFAGIASGLLAPDPQRVVGPPGAPVDVAGVGSIVFPALSSGDSPEIAGSGRAVPIGSTRYAGAFALRTVERTVIAVEAFDRNGARLTVTQPLGPAFSSPVLLMRQTQRISGLDLPFDSFSIPAAHRIVKVVLFSPAQAALMRSIGGPPQPVVLFAVDDDADEPLAHAIVAARNAQRVSAGGVQLQASILSYPAVDVLAVPSLAALLAGFALLVAGSVLGARTPSRS